MGIPSRHLLVFTILPALAVCGCSAGPIPICGGPLGAACPTGQYCRFTEGSCGENNALGLCEDRSEVCTEEFAPVCGCDGQTYDNACFAAMAGVSVDGTGACPSESPVCGGIAGVPCDQPDEFCKTAPGECCCDFQGVCTPMPDTCIELFDPVCGCDGETYGNSCLADQAGVSIDHEGECLDEGQCHSAEDCPDQQFCIFEPGSCGGDGTAGTCMDTRLILCSPEEDPVCGCDGNTYLNECVALIAGVSVQQSGECGQSGAAAQGFR